ncbi:MAG: ankyrin repeat domain-containing protein [Blastocatellia bacterium]|nr:ankyrin repeat domain-containing protein [Blastocatellia bacterium]
MKVKSEFPPTRCEVCHQTDCFDPERNFCARCDGISPTGLATGWGGGRASAQIYFPANHSLGRTVFFAPLCPALGILVVGAVTVPLGWGFFSEHLYQLTIYWLACAWIAILTVQDAEMALLPDCHRGCQSLAHRFLKLFASFPVYFLIAIVGGWLGGWFLCRTWPVDVVYKAALHSDAALKVVLKLGVAVNSRDGFGRTALFYAVRDGSPQSIEQLASQGAWAENPECGSFLTMAFHRRDSEIVEAVLKAGLDGKVGPTSIDLIRAVEAGDYECVRFYLELVPREKPDSSGTAQFQPRVAAHAIDWDRDVTALMLAVWKSDRRIVELLLEAGAETGFANYPTGVDAYALAVYRNDEDMQNLLLRYGARRSQVKPAQLKEIEKIFQPVAKAITDSGTEDFSEADMLR